MIQTYTLDECDKWDNIVCSFKKYDVYYLSGYVKAFEKNGDGKAILVYYQDTDAIREGRPMTRAINVVMKRDISEISFFKDKIGEQQWFDVVTPYGYGGFITEGTNYQGIKREYDVFCKQENIVAEFVRFHPVLRNWERLDDMYEVTYLGNTVCIDTTDVDTIWSNISSKNRNMIRKAKKEGLAVYWCRTPEIIKPFMEIYKATMDRDEAASYYYFGADFYESILNDLKHNAMWFYTMKGTEIVAISIFMFCNGQMHYHLSASKREYSNLAPSNLLIYEAAVWAAKNGYKTLHMGGGVGAQEDSLYKFKKSFNRGEDKQFCVGKKIYNTEMYQKLTDMRFNDSLDSDANSFFFPVYRS